MESLSEFAERFRTEFPEVVGQRVLVALSGGPDSVALLHLLAEPGLGLQLEAAYVHHFDRGAEADQEVLFCRDLCHRLEVPFHLVPISPPAHPEEGREATWRRLRYEALFDLAARRSLPFVATGHHRDDVAEGVLVQLLRGCGPRALAGIAATAPSGLIRPLLGCSRQQLRAWLLEHDLPWREDSSNRGPQHLRNRVRLDLLPTLEAHSPRLRDHLVALAATLAEDEAFLAGELADRAHWIEPWSPDGSVPLDAIAALPPALRSRWLHAQAAHSGIGRATRRQVELLHGLLDRSRPRAVTLTGRWRLRAAGGRLWLEPPGELPSYRFALEPGAVVELPIPGWRVAMVPASHGDPARGWRWSPPDGCSLTVRSPQPGDAVEEDGRRLSARRLLAGRVPRHLRGAWPVVCVGDRMCWIPGVWQGTGSGGRYAVEVIRG